jgi:hypothetical protein
MRGRYAREVIKAHKPPIWRVGARISDKIGEQGTNDTQATRWVGKGRFTSDPERIRRSGGLSRAGDAECA